MAFAKFFLLFLTLAASAHALATPLVARSAHHRALANRFAEPDPLAVRSEPLRKRQSPKRCRPRPVSASAKPDPQALAPASSSSSESPRPATTQVAPPPATTAHEKPETTQKPATTPVEPGTTQKLATTHVEPQTTQKPANTHVEPQTTQKPATIEKPTSTQQEKPPAPTKAPTADLPSFLVGTQSGQGTFYDTGLGACGVVNNNGDFIVAVSRYLFDSFPGYNDGNPNHNPICGKQVVASAGGKSITVTVTDRCEGCALTDLDFSPSAFQSLADPDKGRIPITWKWVSL